MEKKRQQEEKIEMEKIEMEQLKAFIKSNEKLLGQFRNTISDLDTHLQDKNRKPGQNTSPPPPQP